MATVEDRCRRMARESRTPGDARRLLIEAADAIKAAYTFAGECLAMTRGEEMTITITATRKSRLSSSITPGDLPHDGNPHRRRVRRSCVSRAEKEIT